MKVKKWKLKDEIVSFPKDWDKNKILKWVNDDGVIRVCPLCGKLDVSYDHFNSCNPSEQAAIRANRDMAGL